MKKYLFIALSILVVSFLSSCKECVVPLHDTKEEERIIPEFSSITLNCDAGITIKERILSDKNKVIISAPSNVLPEITTLVKGKNLTISSKKCFKGKYNVQVFLYINEISKIANDGSGVIRSENTLKSDRFDVRLDGSGLIDVKLRANRIKVNHDGSGKVILSGNTNELDVRHDGSGECDLSTLKSRLAKVRMDGSGISTVNASEKGEFTMDGSGSILYKGNPREIKINKDGSGEIREVK